MLSLFALDPHSLVLLYFLVLRLYIKPIIYRQAANKMRRKISFMTAQAAASSFNPNLDHFYQIKNMVMHDLHIYAIII